MRNKLMIAIPLVVADVALMLWMGYRPTVAALCIGLLAVVCVSAIVDRIRFGRRPSTLAARLELGNVLTALATWDIVLFGFAKIQ